MKINHNITNRSIVYPMYILFMAVLLAGCGKSSVPELEPGNDPSEDISRGRIVISDIRGIPDYVTFDRFEVKLIGDDWQAIEVLVAQYVDGEAVILLPSEIAPELLQKARQSSADWGGRWPATVSDPEVMVASVDNDIVAYSGSSRVGRVYLSDWDGQGSTAYKSFIYYHYADRAFYLTGYNGSFVYDAHFIKGWNVYSNTNQSEGVKTLCTTTIPDASTLHWRFESWVYN